MGDADRLVRGACRRVVQHLAPGLAPAQADRAVDLAYGIATARPGVTIGAAARAAVAIVERDAGSRSPSSTVEVLERRPIPLPPVGGTSS